MTKTTDLPLLQRHGSISDKAGIDGWSRDEFLMMNLELFSKQQDLRKDEVKYAGSRVSCGYSLDEVLN